MTLTSLHPQLLEWDTHFFGKRIGRISGLLDASNAASVDQWSAANQMDCLYYLVDLVEQDAVDVAQRNGFLLRDVRMTFQVRLDDRYGNPPVPENLTIRLSTASDYEILRPIARQSYRYSRFYADPHFSEEDCERLYDEWLRRSILDPSFGGTVLIAVLGGEPIGYMTFMMPRGEQLANMALLGVREDFRGQRFGYTLVDHTLAYFFQHGVKDVEVATQARNIGAQRIFQSVGFRSTKAEAWLHKWYTP